MYNHQYRPTPKQLEAVQDLEKLGYEVLVLSGKVLFCNQDRIIKTWPLKATENEKKAEYKTAEKLQQHYINEGLITKN